VLAANAKTNTLKKATERIKFTNFKIVLRFLSKKNDTPAKNRKLQSSSAASTTFS